MDVKGGGGGVKIRKDTMVLMICARVANPGEGFARGSKTTRYQVLNVFKLSSCNTGG